MTTPLPAIPLSVLDLVPVEDGATPAQGIQASIALARRADELGYTRFWVAEHHGMPGIASSAPAVLIGALADATERIRVGSGGVMLPNHAPLVIAEQFGTLEVLHPGRIDLGLGRAPGTDPRTAAALRRSLVPTGADDFPQQLGELACFLDGQFPDKHPYAAVAAVPHAPTRPPIWLLGSSLYSAELAGLLGLPFAFAHHFSGGNTLDALGRYRDSFRPSPTLERPHAMVTVQTVCAPTDDEADWLSRPSALSYLRLRQGRPGPLPTPQQAADYPWTPLDEEFVLKRRDRQAMGSPERVRASLARLLAETAADELMITTQVFDPTARIRSLELTRALFADDLPQGFAA